MKELCSDPQVAADQSRECRSSWNSGSLQSSSPVWAGGGILKGATGPPARPILAVPAMAMIFDVRLAVVVMMMPETCSTNLWQAWQFRGARLPAEFSGRLRTRARP